MPRRLLLVGLPLTIVLGYAVGVLVFDDLSAFEIALLATMLAPTDAALGKAVVTNEALPVKIRESLNAESGLNDGICVPILFVFLALATATGVEEGTTMLALTLVAEEIGIGLTVGIGLTILGGWVLGICADRGWVTESWRQPPVVALAISCFALAQAIGGSGFIACFTGGILFGWVAKARRHRLLLAAEGAGDTLALITWVVFGAAVVGQSSGVFSWQAVIYALLSLTVIRMLPVFLSLLGTGLRTDERLFMGWFGPRGLASIVFGVIVLQKHLPGGGTITMTVVLTVLFSIIGHGLSANPFVAALAARIRQSAATNMMSGPRHQYAWHVCGFMCGVVCVEAGPNALEAFDIAMLRSQQTTLGIAVYALVAVFIWPASSGADFNVSAAKLAAAQHELYLAYLAPLRDAGRPAEVSTRWTEESQAKAQFDQLLDAAVTDDLEIGEWRRQWRR